ncbi:MAG: glutathione transferase GstA [Rhizobiales bacterium]|nr:glutathione transferase GstA [Hyphomicrobiales bacterium]MDQ3558015.1 glutathione transferase GstA [Pseudomonadota bacterium]
MQLYYAPGACSLAPHIVGREAGLALDLVKVDLAAKKTADGGDFYAINPKGYVPAIRLDNGEVLTEAANVVGYLADQKPDSGLAPAAGGMERYRYQEWLTFVSSELHKGFGPLFNPKFSDDAKQVIKEKLAPRLAWLDKELAGRQFLAGDRFSAADAYAFTILRWANPLKVDLAAYPNIRAYMDRVGARPKVQEALRAEGLLETKAA